MVFYTVLITYQVFSQALRAVQTADQTYLSARQRSDCNHYKRRPVHFIVLRKALIQWMLSKPNDKKKIMFGHKADFSLSLSPLFLVSTPVGRAEGFRWAGGDSSAARREAWWGGDDSYSAIFSWPSTHGRSPPPPPLPVLGDKSGRALLSNRRTRPLRWLSGEHPHHSTNNMVNKTTHIWRPQASGSRANCSIWFVGRTWVTSYFNQSGQKNENKILAR